MTIDLQCGDARQLMAAMPAQSVQCCITSPPYWGLRDFQIDPVDWPDGWRGCLGLEPTPEMFTTHLVECFRAVRRVLRDDGVCWVNLGFSYASGKCGGGSPVDVRLDGRPTRQSDQVRGRDATIQRPSAGTNGNLLPLPWIVAMALQADGWCLRSAIVWAKGVSFRKEWSGSVMPESLNGIRWERCKVKVGKGEIRRRGDPEETGNRNAHYDSAGLSSWRDCPGCPRCGAAGGYVLRRSSWRPTSAYEMVFMLTKGGRYFADAERARESAKNKPGGRFGPTSPSGTMRNDIGRERGDYSVGRNPRNVWAIGTKGTRLKHYASFPERLVEPMVRASTSKTACGICGAAWAPVVEIDDSLAARGRGTSDYVSGGIITGAVWESSTPGVCSKRTTSFYRSTCIHDDPSGRCVVLDPFCGTGTVGVVALREGCDFVGIDIKPEYLEMARERMAKVIGQLFVPQGVSQNATEAK